MMWPSLPTTGFITGRIANKDDVAKGDAVFFLMGGGNVPVDIEVPQYAIHFDVATGKQTAGTIIQAERTSDGRELLAMQPIDEDGPLVALSAEYQLLGKNPSREN